MEIYQIKTINGGFKGMEVSYTENRTEKNGRKFTDDVTKEKNDPIHGELDIRIKRLRKHLLEICGLLNDRMDQAEIDYNIAETEITGIQMKKTFFILEGEKEWLNDKRFKLKSPKIEKKDNYTNTDEIVTILEEIRKETETYMRGTAKVSEEEAAVRWITSGKNKSFTIEDYNNMSLEEKAQWHKEFLENEIGGSVMLPDDIEEKEEQQEEQEVYLDKF